LGLVGRRTAKMEEGRIAQERLEKLEVRRALTRYGLEGRRREFRVDLASDSWGLTGYPDLLLKGDGVTSVVEFKLTGEDPNEGHWIQVGAYAVLVEAVRGVKVDSVMIYRIPDERIFRKEFHQGWTKRLRRVLTEIDGCVEARFDPGPTEDRRKCENCEYVNFCGDTW
jgi:CRISPR-associated exonuclease Cas4